MFWIIWGALSVAVSALVVWAGHQRRRRLDAEDERQWREIVKRYGNGKEQKWWLN